MTYEKYIDYNPKAETLELIETAETIIDNYVAAGYVLTLRQLYYQFVARDIIPNTERSYKNLGNIITKARMAGMLSWEAIEDRNREHRDFWYDEDIMNPILQLPNFIRFNRWERQSHYVEVWVEKEALGNVINKACQPFYVPHMSCKGYLSASEAWRAGKRFEKKMEQGYECVLIHLGDHDPSGIDMTRDNKDRLDIFTRIPNGVAVERIALNMNQVEEYDPPPNPAKLTDSRAVGYIRRYGRTSWELDALEPQVLVDLIQNKVKKYIDLDAWNAVKVLEEEAKSDLRAIYDNWDTISEVLGGC